MIDENKTFKEFGYYSANLTYGSHKKVYVICDNCKMERCIQFRGYTNLCKPCSISGNKHPLFGKHRSEKTKEKISESNTGKKRSDETKKKFAGRNHPMYSKKHSKESRKKMSENAIKKFGKDNPMYEKFGEDHPRWNGGYKKSIRKRNAKRKRFLDPNPIELNKDFKGSHGHHINSKYIINIPAKLHKSISHRQTDGKGMNEINKVAFKYLYNNKENIILDEEAIYLINLECYNK